METTLFETGPSQKRLIITLSEYEKHRLLDIRYWYLNKNFGEFRRTKKGISLTERNYAKLKRSLDEFHEEILDWLGVSYIPEHIRKYSEAQQKSLELNKNRMGEISRKKIFNKRDNLFFFVEHKGGIDEIYYNDTHPFCKELKMLKNKTEENKLLKELIDSLLISYVRSKKLYENSPSHNPKNLFENLEETWAMILKNYLSGD